MARPHLSRLMRQEAIDGYMFISPWLIGFVLFVAFPMAFSLVLSMMQWDLFSPAKFVGLQNFNWLFFQQPLVWKSLWNTIYFTLVSVPFTLAVSLFAALLLNQSIRGLSFFRTFFYLPSVVPAVSSAILWMWIYNPTRGLANVVMSALHLPTSQWIFSPITSKMSLVLMGFWAVGNTMIIFLAGLQGIPLSLYEAAEIDGASWWHRFRHVTLPMLSPVILFNMILGVVASFQVFTNAFLMTQGGPQNSTLFSVLYLYRVGFEQFNMGPASALAWMLFAIIMAFTLVQLRMSDAWVYYEGKV